MATTPSNALVYQIKVKLLDAPLLIWRKLEVSSEVRLDKLHLIIQTAMGWENAHLYQYILPKLQQYIVPEPEDLAEYGHFLASEVSLAKFLSAPKQKLRYEYDFGDNWQHDIVLEKILPFDSNVNYPRCLSGKGACPPEDCGGVWGYEELLAILADPKHKEHKHYREWLGLEKGEEWDPKALDIKQINQALTYYFG
ncbi:MAG: hypothetical protein OHK0053_11840 [Microscillaceae bacterium]